MKKSLTVLVAACLFSVTGAFAQEAEISDMIKGQLGLSSQDKGAEMKKCPEGAMLMAGYMCQKDKPDSGCSHEEGFYDHRSVNAEKCFSCQSGTTWNQAEFACLKK